jgi:Domain of unknown function (DUF4139)/N-terminal domain of unknown function (DUF4140)
MNKLLVFIFSFCSIAILSAQEIQPVVSKIEKITVFLSGAQITRTASAPIKIGRTELIFQNLSPYILKESVQVNANGRFTVLSVNHQQNYLQEQTKKEAIIALQSQIDQLTAQLNAEKSSLQIYKSEEKMLERNQVQLVGIQNNAMKANDLKEIMDFQRARLTEILNKSLEIDTKIKSIQTDLTNHNSQFQQIQNAATTTTGEIVVTIQAKETGTGDFTLSYAVPKAQWSPMYDVRVKDISSPIQANFKANIAQNTNEDWKNVKLTLSTGNPTQSGNKPTLNTWWLGGYQAPVYHEQAPSGDSFYKLIGIEEAGYVSGTITDKETGETLVGASLVWVGTTIGAVTDVDGKFKIQIPSNTTGLRISYAGFDGLLIPAGNLNGKIIDARLGGAAAVLNDVVVTGYGGSSKNKVQKNEPSEKLEVTETQQTTTTSYQLDQLYTIASDGKNQIVDVKEVTLPATYEYYCVPKLEKDAFLTAQITNWDAYNLLSGEANLYFEGTYLGKSFLNTKTTTDTLTISLGRDKNIVVTREKQKDFKRRQLLGSHQTDTRAWEIAVKNKKSQPISLVIEDQLPVSKDKDIEVEKISDSNAQSDEKTGKLMWRLQIPPSGEQKKVFKYSVKYPKKWNMALE